MLRQATVSAIRRAPAQVNQHDFAHHASGVARLNHGSFGACPEPVIRAEAGFREAWRANPDAYYFATGPNSLDASLASAAEAAAGVLRAPKDSVALVENATVATAIVAKRWAASLREAGAQRTGLLMLDVCYKAVEYSIRAECEPAGGVVHMCHVPFPETTTDAILRSVDATLAATKPRFALLDHVSSQPALVLPIAEMVALCREHGVEEIAIDGAHAVGMLDLDVPTLGADFYYTNLHKWAFAPSTVSALHATEERMASTRHVVPSWHTGCGLAREARWPGTRDFAAFQAVPAAVRYLDTWRSIDGLCAREYNREGCAAAAAMLSDAWGVGPAAAPELSGSMAMVQLPPALDLSGDRPGQPSEGVRATLRERYGIEAAVGGFGNHGGFLRLSHAVYNSDEDFERLRDAVLELVQSQ